MSSEKCTIGLKCHVGLLQKGEPSKHLKPDAGKKVASRAKNAEIANLNTDQAGPLGFPQAGHLGQSHLLVPPEIPMQGLRAQGPGPPEWWAQKPKAS